MRQIFLDPNEVIGVRGNPIENSRIKELEKEIARIKEIVTSFVDRLGVIIMRNEKDGVIEVQIPDGCVYYLCDQVDVPYNHKYRVSTKTEES